MAFSSLMGVTVDYRIGTAPSVSALIDYSVPSPPSAPILADYLATQFPATTIQTDYAIVDNVSSLTANTPVRTYILVTEHYEASAMPLSFNVGEPFANALPVSFSIRSTSHNTAMPLGLAVTGSESHPAMPLSVAIGTEFIGPMLPLGFSVGEAGTNTLPIGMSVESVKRRLDVEVSLITTELQEVEEEP